VVDDIDTIFSAFADPTRIRILNILAAGELCVCDILGTLDLPQPTVSRHLAVLRNAALVEVTRDWKYAYYRLAVPDNAVHRNLIGCVRSFFAGIKSLESERRAASKKLKERQSDHDEPDICSHLGHPCQPARSPS